MSRIIIWDMEVFKYDTLLGAKIIDQDQSWIIQTWDLDEMRTLYQQCRDDSIWVGHNSIDYDSVILKEIIKNKDPYTKSKELIGSHSFSYNKLAMYQYDLMAIKPSALKTIEAFEGKDICETEVDFDLDRPLTEEEKRKTERYNLKDLEQTESDFNQLKENFELRIMLLNTFKLPLTYLSATEASISAKVLKACKIPGVEKMDVAPKMYPNLQIKNEELISFYMNRDWASGKTLTINLCGTDCKIASGGIHGAEKQCHYDSALYIDVSGYYNLIMILFNLLPRSIPDEGKQIYAELYHQQLLMKKTNPRMRAVFKIILLAVFGAQNNKNCDFYDPHQGDLVRMTGQMFLVDLLEKLEGYVHLIQANTDGIMLQLINGHTEDEVKEIVNEWLARTGFAAKFDHIYNLTQRDVNNYIYIDDKGNVETKGEAVKHYGGEVSAYATDAYKSKEALIFAKCIVEFIVNGIDPAETVEKNKRNPRMFQYICRKNTYDYLQYEEKDINTKEVTVQKLQHVNRAFAMKSSEKQGMVYKCKYSGKHDKVSNLPDSVFVYNSEILSESAVDDLVNKIDYDYYVLHAYERILKFVGEVEGDLDE